MKMKWTVLMPIGLGIVILSIYFFPNQIPSTSVTPTPLSHAPKPTLDIEDILADAPPEISIEETREHIEAGQLDEQHPYRAWRKPSSAYARFFELNDKALNTNEEREEFRLLLNSSKLLNHARDVLLSPVGEEEIDYVNERKRLDAVYYLSSILTGKFNSDQFDLAVELSYKVLSHTNTRKTQAEELRRSLLGDKIELGMDLAVFQPELWTQYKQQYPGDEKHARLIEYIDNEARFQHQMMKDRTDKLAQRLRENVL